MVLHTFGYDCQHCIQFYNGEYAVPSSSSVYSKPSNQDYETLIRVLLCFTYGSKADLGWDPTIAALIEEGRQTYLFDVSGKSYRTMTLLSDHGAH